MGVVRGGFSDGFSRGFASLPMTLFVPSTTDDLEFPLPRTDDRESFLIALDNFLEHARDIMKSLATRVAALETQLAAALAAGDWASIELEGSWTTAGTVRGFARFRKCQVTGWVQLQGVVVNPSGQNETPWGYLPKSCWPGQILEFYVPNSQSGVHVLCTIYPNGTLAFAAWEGTFTTTSGPILDTIGYFVQTQPAT